jgi:CheY-like chemotaxis protein
MPRARILIVEDDRDNLGLIRFILERADYEVLEAHTGLEGLKLTREEVPDLVLLDLAMPELDGWTVAKKLKADPNTQKIPVVALTVRTLSEDRKRALAAGCDGYMTKPMNVASFAEEIASFIEKSNQSN